MKGVFFFLPLGAEVTLNLNKKRDEVLEGG